MLGWEIFAFRAGETQGFVAHWRAGPSGLDWLGRLSGEKKAVDLGGNGYPNRYYISARILFPLITLGIPRNDGPPVIGDDYILPAAWSGDIEWNQEKVLACHPDEILTIEAWDLS